MCGTLLHLFSLASRAYPLELCFPEVFILRIEACWLRHQNAMSDTTVVEASSARALRFPHILSGVLAHLFKSLPHPKQVRLVNKQWADIGSDFMWEWALPCHLRHVPPGLRQSVANKVKCLTFLTRSGPDDQDGENEKHENELSHDEFKDLIFPKLQSLSLGRNTQDGTIPWKSYLQPRLKSLYIYDMELTPGLMQLITQRCPRLERAMFDSIGSSLSKFRTLVNRLESLSDLTIGMETEGMGEGLFKHLAGLDRIKRLGIRDTRCNIHNDVTPLILDEELFQSTVAENEDAFRHFEELLLRPTPHVMKPLASRLPNIRVLQLSFMSDVDNCQDVFGPVSTLTTLKDLSIIFPRTGMAHSNCSLLDLAALKGLVGLDCRIFATDRSLEKDRVDDATLMKLLENMPKVESLSLEIPSKITAKGLERVARLCPRLKNVLLEGSFELDQLPKGVLPNLSTLTLKRPQTFLDGPLAFMESLIMPPLDDIQDDRDLVEMRQSAGAISKKIHEACPKLHSMSLDNAGNYSRRFKNMIQQDFMKNWAPPCCRLEKTDDEDDYEDEEMPASDIVGLGYVLGHSDNVDSSDEDEEMLDVDEEDEDTDEDEDEDVSGSATEDSAIDDEYGEDSDEDCESLPSLESID